MGKQVAVSNRRQYRPYSHSFCGTVLWVVPCMIVLLIVGFITGRDFIAPRYLEPSKVGATIKTPVRILSPEEARQAARDEPSHVWTKGVQPSDIPKLENEQPRRTLRRSKPAEPATGTTETPAPATRTPTTPTPETTPPPTDAPATDDGGATDTYIPQD